MPKSSKPARPRRPSKSDKAPPAASFSYETPWKSPIFEHPRSFWLTSYGTDFRSRPDGKIVVFGFPKSGNSWAVSLLADYFECPVIDPVVDVGATGVGMTHLPFCRHVADRADFLRGVCMVRDPRDVVLSYSHYSQTDAFKQARPEFHYQDLRTFYYDWFLSRAVPAHRFNLHADQYAGLGVPTLRYEALRAAPADELCRLLRVWGDKADQSGIEASVEANELSKLQREGKMLNTFTSSTHFRKGAVGDYKTELPADIIMDVEVRFNEMIGRWGYGFVTEEGRRAFQANPQIAHFKIENQEDF